MALLGAQIVQAVQPVPVGSLQAYAGSSAPAGWLVCDGSQQPIATYPELYSVVGTAYGATTNGAGAAGSTHFRLPDLRGRMPLGAGTGIGLNASGSGLVTGNSATARARGDWGGEETHLLTGSESGTSAHKHATSRVWTDIAGNHQHNYRDLFAAGQVNYALGTDTNSNGMSDSVEANAASRHNNMPPFVVLTYIIKAISDAPRSGIAYGTTPPILTTLPSNPAQGEQVTLTQGGEYYSYQYDGSQWVSLTGGNGYATDRNRVVNGSMQIDERNQDGSLSAQTTAYVCDRWKFFASGGGNANLQRVTNDGPPGMDQKSAKITVNATDTSIAAGDYYMLQHSVEGYLCSDLLYGSASALSTTLTFWVKATMSGTFPVAFANAAVNRSYVTTYTIGTPNTWEKKTITLPGDTTGTWEMTTSAGMVIKFSFPAGSTFHTTANQWTAGNFLGVAGGTNLWGTASASIQFSAVQWEAGSATPFERKAFTRELDQCRRYYERHNAWAMFYGGSGNSDVARGTAPFFVSKRVVPSAAQITLYSGTSTDGTAGGAYISNTNSLVTGLGASSISRDGFWTIGKGGWGSNQTYSYACSYTVDVDY